MEMTSAKPVSILMAWSSLALVVPRTDMAVHKKQVDAAWLTTSCKIYQNLITIVRDAAVIRMTRSSNIVAE